MKRPLATCLATAMVAALLPSPAGAWGFPAHRLLNARAVDALPEPLHALFAANRDYLAEHATDPDLRRAAGDRAEEPNHFLDMDAFGAAPFSDLSTREAEHVARFGAEARAKGRVPWQVAGVYAELTAAFRARDTARALQLAAALGHYAGDAHVPLHAAVDYDGVAAGQRGVHARWEEQLFARFSRQLEDGLSVAPAEHVADPAAATLEVLRASFAATAPLIASDRACAGPLDLAATSEDDRYGDDYYSCLYAREGSRMRERLAGAAHFVASLWQSAWEDAGRPALDPAFRFPYVRGQQRVILASLDGAAAPVIADAVARGVMPHLARLRTEGFTVRGALSSLPSKTAPGHASLLTGAWTDRNGIGGNTTEVPGAALTDVSDGFDSTGLRAEPLWVTAARQGLPVTVAQATQVWPFTPYLSERRFGADYGRSLTLFDSYGTLREPARVYTAADLPLGPAEDWYGDLPAHEGALRELRLDVLGATVHGLLYDDPADPVAGLDTLYLALDKDAQGGVLLKPEKARGADPGAFRGLSLRLGGRPLTAFFRLFALAPDGSSLLLLRASLQQTVASRPRLDEAVYAATGGMSALGAPDAYESGALGPRLWEGGDGTAEARLLEVVALGVRQARRLTEFAAERTSWKLLISYLPEPDELLHLWMGRLDPSLPGHDPALAARLRPFLDQGLAAVDQFVGSLSAQADEHTAVIVAGDHGLVAADRVVRPNVVLRRAGLLSLDGGGRLDLAHTQALYTPGNFGFVVVNSATRRSGIVPAAEDATVRARVIRALRDLRDPRTGIAPVIGIRDTRGPAAEPGIGGPGGGDLYLSLAPGYTLSGGLQGEPVQASPPRGEHVVDPQRFDMQVAVAGAGDGLARGRQIGLARIIDLAPTVCALLGIEPPAQATGRVLSEALARPLPAPPAPSGAGR